MKRSTRLLALLPVLPLLALSSSCEPQGRQEGSEGMTAAAAEEIPVTTSSEEALAEFMAGQQAVDMGRIQDAKKSFEAAAQKDPGFGYAYLGIANTAASLAEFKINMDLAAANMDRASAGEKLLVDINMTFFDNDVAKRLELSKQLVDAYPASRRAWMALAAVQANLQKHEEARGSLKKALELDQAFAPAHTVLGFSHLFNEPRDLDEAERHLQRVVEMYPDEANALINLGDAQRGSRRLEQARASYRKATEVDPTNARALSKSGHVNSFLGNYDEARSDYDRAIEAAEGGVKAAYGNFRAYVRVYAGSPRAAVEEMEALLGSLESMGVPEGQLIGARINVLSNMAVIAMHDGLLDAAERAVARRNALVREDAKVVGSEDFERRAEADVAFWEGLLAARKGDFKTARASADENARLVSPDNNPRKMETYHGLMGLIELLDGNSSAAVSHLRQADPNDVYIKYHLALAEEGSGNTEEATRLFTEVANWNFNSSGYASVRNDALKRVKRTAA
jgi:tetratricopeptide (TPR) repeat protein